MLIDIISWINILSGLIFLVLSIYSIIDDTLDNPTKVILCFGCLILAVCNIFAGTKNFL